MNISKPNHKTFNYFLQKRHRTMIKFCFTKYLNYTNLVKLNLVCKAANNFCEDNLAP